MEGHISLPLNQKLGKSRLHVEGMLKVKIGQSLCLLHQIDKLWMQNKTKTKKTKFLKEFESATPVNTQMIKKHKRLIADMEIVLLLWVEDEVNCNIPLR